MLAPLRFSFLAILLAVLLTAALASTPTSPFPCTGGSVYFTAHTVDGLLFQNPDLLRDLFVFKCVTTVVFNADTGGEAANGTRMLQLERGLEAAYWNMSGLASSSSAAAAVTATTVQIGKYNISASPILGLENAQILYLRLPESSTFYGQGYQAYGKETLKKLYSADISAISSTDGRNRYTVTELKDVVATILRFRRAKDIRVLDYADSFSVTDTDDVQLEHADRVASAKIVVDVVREEGIPGTVKGYACDALRNLKNNLHTPDYIKKLAAFFVYARHDPDMCQSLQECGDRLRKINAYTDDYYEGNHIYEFLKREYYASPA
ncbi:hypothetical protein P3342_001130 [Pyrenophora teres f. teres]|uniref:Uncharacterized protein n=1 Tax=Pyrenophora teres f. teres TaxID=97479 RepID=A0A6S6VUL4_9PLEO|nr:hypothetical protein HRS9122_10339 [Pyrenophora teres f. teres]KAE8835801.1 hypothetical protein HRS9139_03899 [Pyrenophora teres f. teres]KAE8838225.1 hypothetical protein PTNB85_05560 [Pyrenophora teres f. teres]KAE8863053.1 hypothetical protein PTNB29_05615 [Pyrenophora teres f. teres]KAE8868712.1 hypothetical protein PTNB73_03765 [Pyrenophora teres f. teres]